MYYPDENGSQSSSSSERSDDHEDLFRNKIQALWQEECFVDVTLACDDKILTAHKLVLTAFSDYFKKIFSSLKYNQHPVIFLKDVSIDVLQAILEFMYCGEVNVAQYNLKAFMKTAHSLKIKGLSMDMEEEPQNLQKRKRGSPSGVSSDNQQMLLSPPMKKKKPLYSSHTEHDYYDLEDEELDYFNEDYSDEDSHPRMKARQPRKQQQRKPQNENNSTNFKRKRNNSFGNSSHSSQQSRSSLNVISAQPITISRTHSIPSTKGRLMGINKEDTNHNLPVEQEYLDNEDIQEDNLEVSFPRGSLTSRVRAQKGSRNSKELSQEGRKTLPTIRGDSTLPTIRGDSTLPASRGDSTLPASRGDSTLPASKGDLLSSSELESRLTRFVVYMSQITPLTFSQVKTFAWGLDTVHGGNHFNTNGPSRHWCNMFKKKYPKMKNILRNNDFLKPWQLTSEKFSFKTLSNYLTPIQEIIEAFNLNESPGNFWSCGEYSVNFSKSTAKDSFRPGRERFINPSQFPAKDDIASVMVCGSAAGEKLPPCTVFKNFPSDDELRKGPATMYDLNSSGYFDSDSLLKWFEDKFLPNCPSSRSEDSPVILLMNSLLPLVSQEMLDMALSENVILLSLMPHLHHACQPMDVSFMRGLRKSIQEKFEANKEHGKELREKFSSLLTDSYTKITPALLKEGFKLCGVFPLSLNVNQEEYLSLTSLLGYDLLVATSLGEEDSNGAAEQPPISRRPRGFLLKKQHEVMNTSDEEEVFEGDSSLCYVCGKNSPKDGAKEGQDTWLKCFNKYCKNFSCQECLPLNYEPGVNFLCIDCKH